MPSSPSNHHFLKRYFACSCLFMLLSYASSIVFELWLPPFFSSSCFHYSAFTHLLLLIYSKSFLTSLYIAPLTLCSSSYYRKRELSSLIVSLSFLNHASSPSFLPSSHPSPPPLSLLSSFISTEEACISLKHWLMNHWCCCWGFSGTGAAGCK